MSTASTVDSSAGRARRVPVLSKGPMATGPRSVSDDDLCSDCGHCQYMAGEMSTCDLGFPGHADDDGYVTSCVEHKGPGE